MKSFLSLLIITLLISCTTALPPAVTGITTFKDPDYKTADFKRILVIVNSTNLGSKLSIESQLVEEFENLDVFAIEGYKLFPPTRTFTNESKREILKSYDIDAYISISVGVFGFEQQYIPPKSATSITKGKIHLDQETPVFTQQTETQFTGGYTQKRPKVEFNIEMVDASNGKTVLLAESSSIGLTTSNMNKVLDSFCMELPRRLEIESLIPMQYNNDIQDGLSENETPKPVKKGRTFKSSLPEGRVKITLKDNQTITGIIISSVKTDDEVEEITVRKDDQSILILKYNKIKSIENI